VRPWLTWKCGDGPLAEGKFKRRRSMAEKTFWQTLKAEGDAVIDAVKEVIHKGNVRRVVIRHGGRTVAEFPLTAGVVGAMLAPMLAAIAAIVAVAKDCTIDVEQIDPEGKDAEVSQKVS
jgi:hypothetical protein